MYDQCCWSADLKNCWEFLVLISGCFQNNFFYLRMFFFFFASPLTLLLPKMFLPFHKAPQADHLINRRFTSCLSIWLIYHVNITFQVLHFLHSHPRVYVCVCERVRTTVSSVEFLYIFWDCILLLLDT